jgi:hypothetical protein
MKRLLLLSIVFFTACASHAPKKLTVARAIPVGRSVSSTGLRVPDQLSEYRLARYVDPRDPLVMHEGHPVYRIENSASWDLRPRNPAAPTGKNPGVRPTVSMNDAVVAEVNKQRAATREVTEQAATLNQRLAELSKAIGETQAVAKENVALKHELSALRERLDALDAQGRKTKLTPQPSPSEDKW